MAHFQATASRSCPHLLFQKGRIPTLTLLLTFLATLAGIQMAQAQDGRSILLKTLRYYQSLHSYLGQANVDTLMIDTNGQTVKHVGSSALMKMQRPNKIFIFLENPISSRKIYSDGTQFSVYEASPNQYTTAPTTGTQQDLLTLLRNRGKVIPGYDALYFLTETSLPKELSDIRLKGTSTVNGHSVYVVTGATPAPPTAGKSGATSTTSYWTWWIDRKSYLLYKVETKIPNTVRPVSFGSGVQEVTKNVRGTMIVRYTVSAIKPDATIAPSDFVFTPPKTATQKRTVEDILRGRNN
ncbi:MAG: putative periplasmic protein [Chthonomonadaceae bacterium]|nr:putative periplasmic protein [Chthonomonadaceae bacterium]